MRVTDTDTPPLLPSQTRPATDGDAHPLRRVQHAADPCRQEHVDGIDRLMNVTPLGTVVGSAERACYVRTVLEVQAG